MDRTFATEAVELAFRLEGTGPLVMLLHGFPDTAATWDDLTPHLVSAGYQTAALHLRGYFPSGIPLDRDFRVRTLADDVLALMDHLGAERGCLIGHDWGASIAYAVAALQPRRTACIVALAVPPLPVSNSGISERLARPHKLYFRLGALSEWWLRRHAFGEVDHLYRKWSPHWVPPKSHLGRTKAAFAHPGYARAAIDYYAAAMPDADRGALVRPISVPALIGYGTDEPSSRRHGFEKALAVVGPQSQVVCFEHVGHWPHLEAPAELRGILFPFLEKIYPATPLTEARPRTHVWSRTSTDHTEIH